MASVTKVLVVGGGIGGLSAGVALRQAGIEVEVAELHPTFNVYGVGIIQPSNALRALDSLGLAEACVAKGSPYGAINMCTATGHQFAKVGPPPLGRFQPHNGISRRVLHDGATDSGANCRMGLSVSALENGPDAVQVTFTDGSTGAYDLVVGADGVYSKVRSLVFGEYRTRYVGQSVGRYALDRPAELETGYMYFGKQSCVGLIPMTKDRMYMFLLSAEGENPAIAPDELLPRMRAALTEYTSLMVLAALAQLTDLAAIVYRPLETLLLPAPWHRDRVVMIGDAAHATIPQLGQGASLASEDAVVLAELLKTGDPLPEVLAQYMARRYDRCKLSSRRVQHRQRVRAAGMARRAPTRWGQSRGPDGQDLRGPGRADLADFLPPRPRRKPMESLPPLPDLTSYAPRDWAVHPPYLVPAYRSTARRAPSQPLVPLQPTLSELTPCFLTCKPS